MLDQLVGDPVRFADIPPPHLEPFYGGIIHPALWLWDSWVDTRPEWIDLYCLALARVDSGGRPILPSERNAFRFHVRRFRSDDGGQSWTDYGSFFASNVMGDGYCARNVWSGSCFDLGTGKTLHALTGLREMGEARPFLQTLFLAEAEVDAEALTGPLAALLCPIRDYDRICAAGYLLGPKHDLGSAQGEEGGPILAWRDPFIWRDENWQLHLLWSAKSGPTQACVGHAVVHKNSQGQWLADLQPPIRLPDGEGITQAEVPKVYSAEDGTGLYLLISGCDRVQETQLECDVTKVHNLYRAASITGPWRPYGSTSVLRLDQEFLYGGSFLDPIIDTKGARFIAPYTERADAHRQLTFESVVSVQL